MPDHNTIADFRKDNGPELRQVFTRFVELCRELVAAYDAEHRHRRQQVQSGQQSRSELHAWQSGRRRAQPEASVARYLSQLDTADRREPTEALAAKTKHLKEKLAKLDGEMKRLEVARLT